MGLVLGTTRCLETDYLRVKLTFLFYFVYYFSCKFNFYVHAPFALRTALHSSYVSS